MSLNWKNGFKDKMYGFKPEQINQNANRFHSIYFIDSVSGSVLVSSRYSDNLTDTSEDLISGFLNAINLFIKEVKDDKEEIQEINFNDTRIIYERKGRLAVIGISRKTNLQIERGILHEILNDFYYRFEHQIKHFKGIIHPDMIVYKNQLQNLNLNSLFKFNIRF
jgi:hypothetical protein